MTFSYVPDTVVYSQAVISLLREEIDDTKVDPNGVFPDGRNFTDEHLTRILKDEGNDYGRFAAKACELLARAYARFPTATRLGPENETVNAFKHYTAEASRLRKTHGYAKRRTNSAVSVPTKVSL